jgi:GNAT superfamily N-acetyltransferase
MTSIAASRLYRLRTATTDHVDAVIGLRKHAEDWLAEAGIEQWTKSGESTIRDKVFNGSTYVVETTRREVVACLSLDAGDPDFWTPRELREKALYLYKFIIRSDHRGTGLGDLLLDWSCDRAERAGALLLRLDCWRTNTGLHDYYLKRGFTLFDVRQHPIRMSGALFERNARLHLAQASGLRLIDNTDGGVIYPPRARTANLEDVMADQYDPTGEAAVWLAASDVVSGLKNPAMAEVDRDTWNSALEQAARLLDLRAREIRQTNGMYYRAMYGGANPPA